MPKEVNFLLALEDHYNLCILYLGDKQTNAHKLKVRPTRCDEC
jgi:hypothetical protein